MSSANVLPSAPPEHDTPHRLYPVLETNNPQNFRLAKVNEIALTLAQEVNHYRLVVKKYKRAKKIGNWGAGGSSFLSAAFSSASLGTTLSVVGLPAIIPLGGAGGSFALVSSGLIIASKKLDSKIKKLEEILTLAIAKRGTVDRLLSKAINDNKVSDDEIQIILTESAQYNVLKEAVRSKLTRQPSRKNVADVEKMKKDIRSEVQEEFRKKLTTLAGSSN